MDTRLSLPTLEKVKLSVRDLNFYYGSFLALKNISLDIPERKVTAFIGPSGCGKSTLLRCFNRLNDLIDGARYRAAWTGAHGRLSWNMVTSRGCPYGCNWCAKPVFGRRYTQRSAANVAEEMAQLRRAVAPDHVWFADDIFGITPRWIEAFAAEVRSRRAAIPFSMQSRVNLMTPSAVEALAEARLAQELDPASVAIRRAVGWAYYYARRYDEAAEHLRRAAALNPTSEETRRVSGLVALARGEWGEAEAAFREALSLSPTSAYSAGGLGAALARAGRTAEARAILADLAARQAQRYVAPVPFAIVHVALGEVDAAFADITRAHVERRGWMAYLRVDPLLDPLRGDPRFAEWLRRMRL